MRYKVCFVVKAISCFVIFSGVLTLVEYFASRTRSPEKTHDLEGMNGKYRGLSRGFLHLIVQFPVVSRDAASAMSVVSHRQEEYIETLQNNLKHPLVEAVHVLYENRPDVDFIRGLALQQAHKLVFSPNSRRMRYSDAFKYASSRLLGRTSIIMNSDCYLGGGFEKLNVSYLKKGIVYALTRHETAHNIRACNASDFCGAKAKYIGSHDAFVFHLHRTLPDVFFKEVDYRPDITGVENLVILMLQRRASLRVRNPCKTLYIYHNHCSKLKNWQGRQIGGQRLEKYLNVPKGIARFSAL